MTKPERARRVGLALPNQAVGAIASLRERIAEIEDWGYDSLWVTDHVVGTRSMEEVYDSHWLEALTTLSWLAAKTTRVRLGAGVLVLPHRDPVLLAKMLATIDLLSGGRLDVGVGTGWSRVEFRALGVENLFEARGRVSNEILSVLRTCWKGGQIQHEGEYYSFKHVDFSPTPVQQPGPPIWVGGHSAPALRRAATFGDGWHPHDISPGQLARLGGELNERAERAVPRSVRLDVTDTELTALPDLMDSYRAAGAEFVVTEYRALPIEETLRRAEYAAGALQS